MKIKKAVVENHVRDRKKKLTVQKKEIGQLKSKETHFWCRLYT